MGKRDINLLSVNEPWLVHAMQYIETNADSASTAISGGIQGVYAQIRGSN